MSYRITAPAALVGMLCLLAAPAMAENAKINPLLTKDLTGLDGKEGTILMVEYPPGGSSDTHKHNAHTFVYVLEGSIVMETWG